MNIPRKIESAEFVELDSELQERLGGLPTTLAQTIGSSVHILRDLEQKQHEEIEKKRLAQENRLIQETIETFTYLSEEIDKAFASESKQLSVSVRGFRTNDYARPTLITWQKDNPGMAAASDFVILELRQKGWEPTYSLSSYTIDKDDGMVYDGNDLVISCSFEN